MGFRTTATMMFGHVESDADIVEHLLALRELQDQTRGFTSFIPWSFKPGNTPLGRQVVRGVHPARDPGVEAMRRPVHRRAEAPAVEAGGVAAALARQLEGDLQARQALITLALADGEAVSDVRVTIMTRDGRSLPISVSTTILRDKRGKVVGAVEFFRDLSVEEELRGRLPGDRKGWAALPGVGAYASGAIARRSGSSGWRSPRVAIPDSRPRPASCSPSPTGPRGGTSERWPSTSRRSWTS